MHHGDAVVRQVQRDLLADSRGAVGMCCDHEDRAQGGVEHVFACAAEVCSLRDARRQRTFASGSDAPSRWSLAHPVMSRPRQP